ncbi:unnamed protein product [Rotaria sp. Silwood1]|nr:unnamed protein product [Rotaria sp. Silwood1]CAF5053159.1 unnamed protein product [Rotaria sp. Silwood1]
MSNSINMNDDKSKTETNYTMGQESLDQLSKDKEIIDGKCFHEKLDYTPDDPNEEERIHEESGNIIRKSSKDILRVERRLAMTRVLGDFIIDKNIIPPIPDIIICSQGQSVAFVIRASNSIWNVMSNEQVASFVIQLISTTDLHQIPSQLLDHCLEKRSRDNMSIYIYIYH